MQVFDVSSASLLKLKRVNQTSLKCIHLLRILWSVTVEYYFIVQLRMCSRPNLNGKETTVDTIGSHTQW